MKEEEGRYRFIGEVHSPFREPEGTPIQPAAARGVKGTVELDPDYREGLKDLDGFSHIVLVYHFHMAKSGELEASPFMDDKAHGVFATRSPARPNPIGISTVRLKSVEGNTLHVENVDILDGTPVLDIKPHVSRFDQPEINSEGWLDENVDKLETSRDDGRFAR